MSELIVYQAVRIRQPRTRTGKLVSAQSVYLPRLTPAPWMVDAACKGMDPEFFFPGRGERTDHIVAFCAECPVRDDCLQHALETRELHGYWGGVSERERRKMRRGRQRPACGTENGYSSHRRHGEDACGPCREAHAAYHRECKARAS